MSGQVVIAADDVAADDAVLVPGRQSTVAGGAREALDVVDGSGRRRRRLALAASRRLQNHLIGRNVLTAAGADPRRTKHSTPTHATVS